MEWIGLVDEAIYDSLLKERRAIVFKHSTRCSLSSMVKRRLERAKGFNEAVYYLDIFKHRKLSDYIGETTGVRHASPQILIFKEGEVVFHTSHTAISAEKIMEHLD